jgi:hypothetical protein
MKIEQAKSRTEGRKGKSTNEKMGTRSKKQKYEVAAHYFCSRPFYFSLYPFPYDYGSHH